MSADWAPPEGGGPVAIVTGAGSGIGAATARTMARRGVDLVLVGRRQDPLRAVAIEVEALGARALVTPADLGDAAAAPAIVREAREAFGRIDAVINNAAIIRNLPLRDWTVDGLDAHWTVNVRAPFLLVQAALPALTLAPWGAVVNVSSSSGAMQRIPQSVYGMTKAALEYQTKALAAELAGLRIRVNCVAPGPVDTPIHATWASDPDAARESLTRQVPLGRIGDAREIAEWIDLLAFDPASRWVTGAVIPIDGGQVLDIE